MALFDSMSLVKLSVHASPLVRSVGIVSCMDKKVMSCVPDCG